MNISFLIDSLAFVSDSDKSVELSNSARILGKAGGSVKSRRKAKAARKNGKLGGRGKKKGGK